MQHLLFFPLPSSLLFSFPVHRLTMHESLHPLKGFKRDATHTNGILLHAPSGFHYELAVFQEPYATIRWRLWRDDTIHALSEHRNQVWDKHPVSPSTCTELSSHTLQLKHSNLLIELDYSGAPHLTVYKTRPFSDQCKVLGAIRGANDLLKHKAAGHRLGDYQDAKIMYKDLPHQSLMVTESGIAQQSLLHPLDAVHFGLGEKAAPLDLTKRRFALGATDAANYDSFLTDPLYKHHPLLFTVPRPPAAYVDPEAPPPDSRGLPPAPLPDENGEAFAILQFNNSNVDGVWDIGRMTNEPLGRFKKYTCDRGGLECFLIFGKDVADVSDVYAQLVGAPKLPSRHWLGYLASSMALADSEHPPAQTLLEEFPAKCKEEDVPCSVMHLSSGYTVSMKQPKNRYVFTFNTDRYPDFKGMIKTYHESGIKISPNIKPFVLKSHPAFPELHANGAFFTDPETGDAATTRIWSAQPGETEEGCWLDMTSRSARDWWFHGCRELALAGCDSLWNDNNEFGLASDHYLAAGEIAGYTGSTLPIGNLGRLTNCTLMAKTSAAALSSVAPDHRTMVLTRSANISTMQHASSTWSGDNYTSWDTIKGNVAMGLQAGMALMHSYGHDVGGFGGPLPSMEMFVRWVQICVWNPRFCIHSFKPDLSNLAGPGKSNSPWMFPQVTHIIRACIKRRYELIPYLYSLHWEGQRHAIPPNAWIGWGNYERDPGCFNEKGLEGTSFWIGVGRLLAAGAYRAGQRTIDVYLPRDETLPAPLDCFYQIGSGEAVHQAGKTVIVDAPLDNIALFAHVGTALPVGKPSVTVTAKAGPARKCIDGVEAKLDTAGGVASFDDWRGLEIFPTPSSMTSTEVYHAEWIEDDGESNSFAVARCAVDFSVVGEELVVSAKWLERDFMPLWDVLWIILPPGDTRVVQSAVRTSTHQGQKCFGIEVSAASLMNHCTVL